MVFIQKKITSIEKENPIAFSILLYKNLYQFIVLMRTLYIRINYHCIHIDAKAPSNLFNYVLKLSTCLENIFISTQRINITWGTINVLQAERICQLILLKKSFTWNYYMTIAVKFYFKYIFLRIINISYREVNFQFKQIEIEFKYY
jgi:core-2/I-Branching enzyme